MVVVEAIVLVLLAIVVAVVVVMYYTFPDKLIKYGGNGGGVVLHEGKSDGSQVGEAQNKRRHCGDLHR